MIEQQTSSQEAFQSYLDTNITIVIDRFLLERESRGLAKKSLLLYRRELGYFRDWLKDKNLSLTITDITTDILRFWFSVLSSHRNKGGTHSNFRIVRSLFNWYWDEMEIQKPNPIKKVKVEKSHNPPLQEISLEQVNLLLQACATGYYPVRDRFIIKCMVNTGCRANEMLSLNIKDVNLQTGNVLVWHGKGDKFRVVFLGKNGLKALKDYLEKRENYKSTDPLIVNDEGKRLDYFGLVALLRRLCTRAGIPPFMPHSFRRLFGLTLYKNKHDLFLCQKMLGHSSPDVTLRYLNVSNGDLADIMLNNNPGDLLD